MGKYSPAKTSTVLVTRLRSAELAKRVVHSPKNHDHIWWIARENPDCAKEAALVPPWWKPGLCKTKREGEEAQIHAGTCTHTIVEADGSVE